MKITVDHKGAYAAKMLLKWKENGVEQKRLDNRVWTTCKTTIDIPDNATDIYFEFYSRTSFPWQPFLLGGTIDNMDIVPEMTISLYGTVLKPSMKVDPELPKKLTRTPITDQLETYPMPKDNEIVVWQCDGIAYDSVEDMCKVFDSIREYFEFYGAKVISIPKESSLSVKDIDDLINELTKLKEEKSNENSK